MTPADPITVLRSRRYVLLLLLAGIIGVPVSAVAWGFLALVSKLRRAVLLTPVVGLIVAGLAISFAEATGKSSSQVLFSGQTLLGPLIAHASRYTVGALVLLLACKGLGYSLSMSSFRGGPVFPALLLGAAGGIALSRLPGLPLIPAVAMGIGAMVAVMLRLPLTAVLHATLLLFSDGLAVMPLVIVAVVVAYLAGLRVAPASWELPGTAAPAPASPAAGDVAATPGRNDDGTGQPARDG